MHSNAQQYNSHEYRHLNLEHSLWIQPTHVKRLKSGRQKITKKYMLSNRQKIALDFTGTLFSRLNRRLQYRNLICWQNNSLSNWNDSQYRDKHHHNHSCGVDDLRYERNQQNSPESLHG